MRMILIVTAMLVSADSKIAVRCEELKQRVDVLSAEHAKAGRAMVEECRHGEKRCKTATACYETAYATTFAAACERAETCAGCGAYTGCLAKDLTQVKRDLAVEALEKTWGRRCPAVPFDAS